MHDAGEEGLGKLVGVCDRLPVQILGGFIFMLEVFVKIL